MSLSPSQAAKLRELVKEVKESQHTCSAAAMLDSGKAYAESILKLFEAERQLDAYITSLTGESK